MGGVLIRSLLRRGDQVAALVSRDRRALQGLDLKEVEGDVTDPASLDRAMSGCQVVYHLAARIALAGDPHGLARRVNVNGTRQVVQACLRNGVRRLVHFSSIHALDPRPLHATVDEDRPLQLRRSALAYDRSKALAELEVLAGVERGLDAVILNPCSVIGPLDFKPSPLGELLLWLCRGRLPSLVAGGFSWVDVRDVAHAALAACHTGRAGQRYILSGHWLPLVELTRMVARAAGVHHPRLTCPTWLARIGAPLGDAYSRITGARALYTSDSLRAMEGYRHLSRARAERELGYKVRPLEETTRDIFNWFREAEML